MPVNKVEYFGNTLLDLTGDNVKPSDVKKGVVFHDATGAQFVGELVQKAGGRPFATGKVTPTSNQTKLTISGLSFRPTMVFIVIGASTVQYISDYQYAFNINVYDSENSLNKQYSGVNDPSYGIAKMDISTNSGITFAATGFSAYVNTYSFYKKGQTYYWYAIGAEG